MASPSPIHRDPEIDGDDYGCVGWYAAAGNTAIAAFVAEICAGLASGAIADGDDLMDLIQEHLTAIDEMYSCGACDTVVKENVFFAICDAIAGSDIDDVDPMTLYGW